jgi:hypothetical protein
MGVFLFRRSGPFRPRFTLKWNVKLPITKGVIGIFGRVSLLLKHLRFCSALLVLLTQFLAGSGLIVRRIDAQTASFQRPIRHTSKCAQPAFEKGLNSGDREKRKPVPTKYTKRHETRLKVKYLFVARDLYFAATKSSLPRITRMTRLRISRR